MPVRVLLFFPEILPATFTGGWHNVEESGKEGGEMRESERNETNFS